MEISSELHDNLQSFFIQHNEDGVQRADSEVHQGTGAAPGVTWRGVAPSGHLGPPGPLSAPIFTYKLPLNQKPGGGGGVIIFHYV